MKPKYYNTTQEGEIPLNDDKSKNIKLKDLTTQDGNFSIVDQWTIGEFKIVQTNQKSEKQVVVWEVHRNEFAVFSSELNAKLIPKTTTEFWGFSDEEIKTPLLTKYNDMLAIYEKETRLASIHRNEIADHIHTLNQQDSIRNQNNHPVNIVRRVLVNENQEFVRFI